MNDWVCYLTILHAYATCYEFMIQLQQPEQAHTSVFTNRDLGLVHRVHSVIFVTLTLGP